VWNDSETKTGGYEGVEMSAMIHFAQSLFHSCGKKLPLYTLIYQVKLLRLFSLFSKRSKPSPVTLIVH
jgi:hypothetical protein